MENVVVELGRIDVAARILDALVRYAVHLEGEAHAGSAQIGAGLPFQGWNFSKLPMVFQHAVSCAVDRRAIVSIVDFCSLYQAGGVEQVEVLVQNGYA